MAGTLIGSEIDKKGWVDPTHLSTYGSMQLVWQIFNRENRACLNGKPSLLDPKLDAYNTGKQEHRKKLKSQTSYFPATTFSFV